MTDNYTNRGTGCPSELHDWPLPTRLIAASNAADVRLANGWLNIACPECGLHGWIASGLRPVEAYPDYQPYETEGQ